MPPDKQTVNCFHAHETDSYSLKTKSVTLRYKRTVCSFMCCFGKAKQMESANNEYIILLNLRC